MPEHRPAAAGPAGPDVETAVAVRLRALEGRPVSEHAPAYDEVHRLLVDALSALDEG